jgi:hypothetical protein
MSDYSYLDRKYFIDDKVYNCPFCNRNNVPFTLSDHFDFNWSESKECQAFTVSCDFCENKSMHLSFDEVAIYDRGRWKIKSGIEHDEVIFYSVPTSYFALDERLPSIVRELITEAEGCHKMNYLTGASACTRKAIYELLVKEKADGNNYEDRIKSLKEKYPDSDPILFDVLAHIQGMTSEKIHEQSWDKWDTQNLKLVIETLKTVLYDIYVLPNVKKQRYKEIEKLRSSIKAGKKNNETPKPEQAQ